LRLLACNFVEAGMTNEERISDYRVHPVAAMFRSLPPDDYEELKASIEGIGLLTPIMVQGDTLLDGRNRLRACIELGIEPRIQEYTGTLKPEHYIETINLNRRHLSEDQRLGIVTKIRAWARIQAENLEKQLTGKSADGTAGGRGKKNLHPKSGEGLRDVQAEHARSTAGQIAEITKVSRHKAEQAIAVGKHAPELADKVAKGEMKLRDAAKVVQKLRPHKPAKRPEPPSQEHFDVEHAFQIIQATIKNCPEKHRTNFIKRIYYDTHLNIWQWLKPGQVLIVNNQTAFLASSGQKEASNKPWPLQIQIIRVAAPLLPEPARQVIEASPCAEDKPN
jgi:hypothetical protein